MQGLGLELQLLQYKDLIAWLRVCRIYFYFLILFGEGAGRGQALFLLPEGWQCRLRHFEFFVSLGLEFRVRTALIPHTKRFAW